MIKHKKNNYDLTMYINVFNNEIISYDLATTKHGSDPKSYYKALNQLLQERERRGYSKDKRIIHSGQGVIYTSQSFAYNYEKTTIKWLDKR